ncbi:uncharacterized protein L969DRAFT_88346 [Mixia osmundae IAM 14324]|uniref:Ribosomal protein L9 domain-containing protein n=1 Tax=Mixia osmundae (strain CBS 9802 / IAM 14324 / JCM 22182 / KY 12970) TaxID=764103 RepID=G7E740_MIXOS|nr:uncharacterized protein L969DRAFT_88346 [Mixia osmundae IAM 14324]KEI38963.1 hypothetical protein L969DRAFT_88346 [Mixia osmundae IAM 14324]GAA98650.1 hypothetical protein E5Q_05338 [Mixia osmundae IAM 14324]
MSLLRQSRLQHTLLPRCICQAQVRTAISSAKRQTIPVVLTIDVPLLGKRGQLVDVAPGRMRNLFYPRGQALYAGSKRAALLQQQAEATPAPLVDAILDDFPATSAEQVIASGSSEKKMPTDAQLAPRIEEALLRKMSKITEPLVFKRNLIDTAAFGTEAGKTTDIPSVPMHGSVTLADVLEMLETAHNVELRNIPSVSLSFAASVGLENDRLKQTGSYKAIVDLRTLGQEYSLDIYVVPT